MSFSLIVIESSLSFGGEKSKGKSHNSILNRVTFKTLSYTKALKFTFLMLPSKLLWSFPKFKLLILSKPNLGRSIFSESFLRVSPKPLSFFYCSKNYNNRG